MININELESRWFKYKIKSILPYVIILISIIVIAAIASVYFFSSPAQQSAEEFNDTTAIKNKIPSIQEALSKSAEMKNQKIPTPLSTIKEIPVIVPTQMQKAQTVATMRPSTQKTVLSPSLDFMMNMQGNTIAYIETKDTEETSPNKPVLPHTGTSKKASPAKKIAPPVPQQTKEIPQIEEAPEANSIQIDRQNTHDDIKHVITRFKKNNNPALSLFIAKKYYQLGEYHQAYNYALITNEINNDIEASWIIFAKSLVKLNEKNMAIKILGQYIEHSHSNRAQQLLDEIKSGKFK